MKEKSPIKIGIAEDHELFKTNLIVLLSQNPDFELIWSASNGKEALDLAKKKSPDLILMDIGMFILNGIEATRLIKEFNKDIKIMILSAHEDKDSVLKALSSGADAYLTKNFSLEKLNGIIATVMEGALWLDPVIATYVYDFVQKEKAQKKESENFDLSQRELDVLRLMAEGKSNNEIASDLYVSIHTVKAHVCSIIQKLSAKDRTHAAVKASKHGIV